MRSNLEQTLGTDEAAILMECMPPVGWADMERPARRVIMWVSSTVVTAIGIAFGAGRLG